MKLSPGTRTAHLEERSDALKVAMHAERLLMPPLTPLIFQKKSATKNQMQGHQNQPPFPLKNTSMLMQFFSLKKWLPSSQFSIKKSHTHLH